MGTRYNAAHIPEADVKEAWSNYAKYDYFYTDELQKAQKTLESTTSSAKAQLAAKGIFEGDPKYTREIDRITNIAQADMASLQAGQTSLQTGAIKDLLTSSEINRASAGNYRAYLGSQAEAMTASYITSLGEVNTRNDVRTQQEWRYDPTAGQFVMQLYDEGTTATRSLEEAGVQSFQDYYTGVWGGYDATIDIRADAEQASSEAARGQAGSRAYTIQARPKGQPGGGKPGNVFMQTPREVAQDQAPQDEQGKAWWM